jgi:hypothetical protein
MMAMFVNASKRNEQFPYLAKLCQRRRFLEIDQSEKRIVWGGDAC